MKKCRRILGVLLVIAMLAAFAPGVAAAWGPPPTIELTQSGSWQQMEFRWTVPGDAQAFFAGVDDGTITYEWNVRRISQNFNLTMFMPLELRQEGILVMSVRANGTLQVSLTVNGLTSEPTQVWLLSDDYELQAVLTQANQVLQNARRYCADYIAQLQAAVAAAQSLYATNETVTQEDISARVAQLDALVSAPQLAMTDSGFFNRFIPSWWRVVDAATAPLRRLQTRSGAYFSVIGQIFAAVFGLEG